eukprot:GSMAST32.ASY1.ANO1.2732.1 assembled CDS
MLPKLSISLPETESTPSRKSYKPLSPLSTKRTFSGVGSPLSRRPSKKVLETPNHSFVDIKLLERIFLDLDRDGDGLISRDEFREICSNTDYLNLSPEEVERVFRCMDRSERGVLNFKQFKKAIRRRRFMSSIVSTYHVNFLFKVMPNYDYTKSTAVNYKSGDKTFHGDFASIRKKLDYSYHVNYCKKRQLWQDAVIKSVASRGESYALSWMSRFGYFPLEDIVHVDPDHFKRLMPEWKGYLEHDNETAGTHCHLESAYMQEIAQEVGLQDSVNMWIDGSLHDVFTTLRLRFPQYRIAIFYVYCSEQEVRRRIVIPESMIQNSLDSPIKSLRLLTPKCDFVAQINNEGPTPILEAFETIDRSGRWQLISNQFSTDATHPLDFPEILSPLFVSKLYPVQCKISNNTAFGLVVPDEENCKLSNYVCFIHRTFQ